MAYDYSNAVAKLIEKIGQYGTTAKLLDKVKSQGSSRNSGSIAYNEVATINVIFTSIKNALIGGAVVVIRDDWLEMTDIVLLADNQQEIKKDQYVEYSGSRYVINQAVPIKPADTVIGYQLFLKGV